MVAFLRPLLYLLPLLVAGFTVWRVCLDPALRPWFDWRFASIIAVTVVGFVAPSVWIYHAAALAVVLVLPRSRVEAAALFVALVFMVPLAWHPTTGGGVRLFDMDTASACSLGLLAALRFPAGRRPGSRGATVIDVAVIGLLLVESGIAAHSPEATVTVILRVMLSFVLGLGVPYYFISRIGLEQDGARRVLHAFAFAALAMALVAMFEMVRHWPLYGRIDVNLGTGLGRSHTLSLRGGLLRAPGPFLESTGFSLFLALGTTIIAANRSFFRSRGHQVAILALAVIGLFGTLARNGWIGALLGLVLLGLYRGRTSRTLAVATGAVVAVLVMLVASPKTSFVATLLGVEGAAKGSAEYRQNLFTYCLPLIRQHPWFGTPIEVAEQLLRPMLRSHRLSVDWVNSYLYFTVGAGLVGAAIFVFVVASPILATWRVRLRARRDAIELEVGAGLFAGSCAFSVMVAMASYTERMPLLGVLLMAGAYQLRASLTAGVRARSGEPAVAPPAPGPLVIDPARPVWAPALAAPAPRVLEQPALVR